MESYIAAKMDEPYTSVQTKLTNIRLCGKKKKVPEEYMPYNDFYLKFYHM